MYTFPEDLKRASESSPLSFVYYQNIGGRAVPVLPVAARMTKPHSVQTSGAVAVAGPPETCAAKSSLSPHSVQTCQWPPASLLQFSAGECPFAGIVCGAT